MVIVPFCSVTTLSIQTDNYYPEYVNHLCYDQFQKNILHFFLSAINYIFPNRASINSTISVLLYRHFCLIFYETWLFSVIL